MLVPGKLILAAGSVLDHTAAETIAAAAAAGFDGVGLRLTGEHGTDAAATLGDLALDHGVPIHDTEVYRIGTTTTDDLVHRSAEARAAAVLIVSDLPDETETIDRLGPFVEQCEQAGLTAGLEYMAWTTPSTPAQAIRVAEAVGCVIVVDVLHHVRVGGTPDDLSEIIDRGLLGWVQICDAGPRTGDLLHEARHARLPPGHGTLPLASLVERLPDSTTISVEVQSDRLARLGVVDRARLLLGATRATLSSG